MKKSKLTKVIVSLLIGASAEWKSNSTGWWYAEGWKYSIYAIGWQSIDGKWYHFDSNGYMEHDTIINGYKIGSDGACIVTDSNTPINTTKIRMRVFFLSKLIINNIFFISQIF